MDDPPEVDVDDALEVAILDTVDRRAAGDPRVVEDEVAATVGRGDLLGPRVDGVAVGDVERPRGDGDVRGRRADEACGLGEGAFVDVGEGDLAVAASQKTASDRPIPEPAPVIAATLSANDFIGRLLGALGRSARSALEDHRPTDESLDGSRPVRSSGGFR